MDEKALSKFLSERDVPFRIERHKAVYNIAEASKIKGVSPEKIVKSILLKDEKGFFLAIVRGTQRIDFDKIRVIRNSKKVRMATPEEVKEQTSVEIGAVNIFSHKDALVDREVLQLEEINAHPDDNSKTAYFPAKCLKEILPNLIVADIAKD